MLIPPHVGTCVPHTKPVHEEGGSHEDVVPLHLDSYISNKTPGARPRIFSVTMTAFQSFHPSPQPYHIIVDEHQIFLGIAFWKIRGGNYISAVCGEKSQPLI